MDDPLVAQNLVIIPILEAVYIEVSGYSDAAWGAENSIEVFLWFQSGEGQLLKLTKHDGNSLFNN